MELGLERFLELVKREMGAVDARIELGGLAPTQSHLLWARVPGSGARVVAVLDSQARGRLELEDKLANLAESFADTIERGSSRVLGRTFESGTARARLDAELTSLASRAGAERGVVFDASSPMIWGASQVDMAQIDGANQELEGWVEELRSDRVDELRSAHGHVVRLSVGADRECLARMFGGLYVLALSFRTALSEPVAVGALLHAADTIERLVLALPPVDPPPGGKVIRLPNRSG
jgi:hypothetical protein